METFSVARMVDDGQLADCAGIQGVVMGGVCCVHSLTSLRIACGDELHGVVGKDVGYRDQFRHGWIDLLNPLDCHCACSVS